MTGPGRAPTLYREVYERIRTSIAEGKLSAGDRLPSARTLAAEFNVARGTVDTAYALLAGEGFLISRARGATFVAPTVSPFPQVPRLGPQEPIVEESEAFDFLYAPALPLAPSLPSFDLFPRKLWSQLVARQARRMGPAELTYNEPMGAAALRNALVGYLAVARGIRCAPEQIVITGGYTSALALICHTMLHPGAEVWVETPGFSFTRRAVLSAGGVPVSVGVDADGLIVEQGAATAPDAAICVTAPSHQFPMGVSMSLARRLALLDWAHRSRAWIVEDDYGGEFRYDSAPLPALKSLDRDDRVFYVGTFSKTLFPSLRLGYLVVPPSQLTRVRRTVKQVQAGRPALEQAVVADFLASGHFGRHIRKMRAAYRDRRAALSRGVTEVFGDRFPLRPTVGGLNLLLGVPAGEDDIGLAERALSAGLRPLALSPLGHPPFQPQGLVLGFANLPEARVGPILQVLQRALRAS